MQTDSYQCMRLKVALLVIKVPRHISKILRAPSLLLITMLTPARQQKTRTSEEQRSESGAKKAQNHPEERRNSTNRVTVYQVRNKHPITNVYPDLHSTGLQLQHFLGVERRSLLWGKRLKMQPRYNKHSIILELDNGPRITIEYTEVHSYNGWTS